MIPLRSVASAVVVTVTLLSPVPALARVVIVDTTVDDASLKTCDDDTDDDCSLRGALVAAAGAAEHYDIRVPSGTYTLKASTPCTFISAFGGSDTFSTTSLCVGKDVAIIGSDADTTILDGHFADRTMVISANATAAVSGVTVTNGVQSGGTFIGGGGGILNHGTTTLTDVVVTANTALAGGGGITNIGTLTLLRTTVNANTTGQSGGGIDNGHTGAGDAHSTGTLTVIDSTISNNNANLGTALSNRASEATLVGSTLSGNTGGSTIFNQGVSVSSVGGGFFGAGIVNATNTTIAGNTAASTGVIDSGRSSPADSSVVNLHNVTIAANTVQSCGVVLSAAGSDTVTVENSIIGGNGNAGACCALSGNTVLVSGGHNVFDNVTGCTITGDTTGNQTGMDPLLGALAPNGGTTETMAPLAGSPVLDMGSPAVPGSGGGACAAADQRGALRPLGVRCDVGAFERSTAFAVTKIVPDRGAAGGSVVALVSGAAFAPGASILLRRTGSADVAGTPITIEAAGSSLATKFDLAGAALGVWDVVVTNPDQTSATLAGVFTVEEPRTPDLWAILIGRRGVAAGQPARFTVVFGNRGNVDAFGVPLTFVFPAVFTTRYAFTLANPPAQPGQPFNDYSDVPVVATTDDATQFTNVPLLLPIVPAGFTGTLDFLVTPPSQLPEGQQFLLSALLGKPFFTGDTPRPELVASMVAGAKLYAADHLGVPIPSTLDGTLTSYASNQLTLAVDEGRDALVADLGHVRSVFSVAHLAIDLAEFAATQTMAAARGSASETWLVSLTRRLAALTGVDVAVVEAQTRCPPCLCPVRSIEPGCSCNTDKCVPPVDPNDPPKKPPKGLTPGECHDIPEHSVSSDGKLCRPNDSKHCPAVGGSPFSTDPFCRTFPISIDPNDKTGSPGGGDAGFVPPGTPLVYAISFENLPAAPAAAQTVTITDQLDPEKVDLATFSFGEVVVADAGFTPPPGTAAFTGAIDLRPGLDIVVKIDATLDQQSGLVTWQFSSLDPNTLDAVTDPDAGFLPPNTNPPHGDGSVAFTVLPKAGLATDTQIRNRASIVFDVNAPLDTPEWLNTIDADPPSSHVDTVEGAACTATDLTVHWSGTDAGSGIARYDVYVSENGGAATPLVRDTADTSAPFVAELGKTYAFYTVARDAAGNVEATPPAADAVRAVVDCSTNDLAVVKIGAPKKVTLTAKKPSKTALVTVKVQNRSPHAETIADAATFAKLVRLEVDSLGTCPAPAAVLNVAKQPRKFPLTVKSKGTLSVPFVVTLDCANDPTKGAGHADYSLNARVDHTPLGSGDAHPDDDVCPRTVPPGGIVDQFPNGKIVDKGCGAKKPDKTFGAPVLIDVIGK